MKQLIVIINGKGGAGKDTCIDEISKYYETVNVSSITPVKQAAKILGWSGDKELKSRKFLSDLKLLSTKYNDYPMAYILSKISEFKQSDNWLMFIHMREPEEINKLVDKLNQDQDVIYTTLLVDRPVLNDHVYGNKADDEVFNYGYEFTFVNDYPNESKLRFGFVKFFTNVILRLSKREG